MKDNEKKTTLYFVCHETESVIKKIELKSSFLLNSSVNLRNRFIMVEKKSLYNGIDDFLAIKFEVRITMDHYLFLMLGIYVDFDDDLLFDAIDLLFPQN
jgi:hypothetical protein